MHLYLSVEENSIFKVCCPRWLNFKDCFIHIRLILVVYLQRNISVRMFSTGHNVQRNTALMTIYQQLN